MDEFDLKLIQDPVTKLYDIAVDTETNDFTGVDTLETSLIISAFGQRRADDSEVIQPERQSGWWGNLLNTDGHQDGSKLWLLEQAKATQTSFAQAQDWLRQGLQWLIDDGIAIDIEIGGDRDRNVFNLRADITFPDNRVESFLFDIVNRSVNALSTTIN